MSTLPQLAPSSPPRAAEARPAGRGASVWRWPPLSPSLWPRLWPRLWQRAVRWWALHPALPRRIAMGGLTLLAILTLALVWTWQATPSPADLGDWVRAQNARHGAPYTALGDMSPWAGRALVAVEDERFYLHHGIDTLGLLRAAWDDLRAGRVVEGGSTITAQLAKNAYLGGFDRTATLKLEDLLLAAKIESHYSKGQILEMYLNLVYFGQGAYGIGAASQRYFGVPASHLDAAQAALLAGMVQAPGLYNPWCHPDLARARQRTVLSKMLANGYLTPAQERTAREETFAFWRAGAVLPPDAYCAR